MPRFGQPSVSKVTAQVAVGDIERSQEAKVIVQLVTQHAETAAAHGSEAVVLYNRSVIESIRCINDAAKKKAEAQEKADDPSLFSTFAQIFCLGCASSPYPPTTTSPQPPVHSTSPQPPVHSKQ